MKKTFFLLLFLIMYLFGNSQLDAGQDTTICKGEIVQLNATGGSNYHWIAIPPDPTLSNPDIPNPTVQPLTTTMYIVESREVDTNRLLNGSFELGNVDFTSEYIYNPVSIWNPGTYAIVDDANDVHPNFNCDSDHTTGSGLMMCVNGASTPDVVVWTTSLSNIDPDAEYEFSTWVSSLAFFFPAVLQFRINGVLLGDPFNASFQTCTWNQFFEVWDSGGATDATISIINQNTASNGNDFSLDDIYFAEVFYLYDTVVVNVIDPPTSTFQTPSEICSVDTAIIEYTGNGVDTAIYHWDFDGATIISGSGQGPFELQWATPGLKEVSLWVEDTCSSETTMHTINVNQSPSAGITADATSIPFGTYTFLHGDMFGNPGPLAYVWEPASQLVDPESLDPQTVNLETSTEFIFTVKDESSQCEATDTILIQISGGALAIISLEAAPDTICEGESTDLQLFVEGGSGNYTATWTSEPPGFSHTGPEMTLQVSPSQTLIYKVTVNDGFNTTPEQTVQVVVNKQIIISKQPADTLLPPGEDAVFGVFSENADSFQWQFSDDSGNSWTDLIDDGTFSGTTTSVLTISPVDETMNGWYFRCLLTGECNPASTREAELNVVIAPDVINELENVDACEDVQIIVPYKVSNFIQIIDLELTLRFDDSKLAFQGLTDIINALESDIQAAVNGNEIKVTWSSNQAVSIPDGVAFNFEFESLSSDSSELSWQESGCSITNVFGYSPSLEFSNSTIIVNPLAIQPDLLHASPDSISIMDNVEIELSAEGGAGDQLVWLIGDCDGEIIGDGNPLTVAMPEVTTDYFARWENGCGSSACQKVTVVVSQEYDVYAPSAFSPNGDGLNDRFELVSPTDLFEFRLQIFSRWGQILFESNNLYEGWDGSSNGNLSPPGVYIWKANYRLRREGQGSDNRIKTGTVVLVN